MVPSFCTVGSPGTTCIWSSILWIQSSLHFRQCCVLSNTFCIHYFSIPFFDFSVSVQFSSVTQSCLTLCDPMNCSMPGLPVHHQLPEFIQTHIHWVGDAIQPSHPLSSPSPPAFNFSQHQGLSNESALCIRWPKYWSFSFNISLPMNTQDQSLGWTDWISLQSKGLSRVFSNTTV